MTADELKAFCKEMGLTYKELAELIGMSESSLRSSISRETISEQTTQSINLLKKINELENELKDFTALKDILKNITK
jgi:hypothetical protein